MFMRSIRRSVSFLSFLVLGAESALGQTGAASSTSTTTSSETITTVTYGAVGLLCEDGPTTKTLMLSAAGSLVGTIAMAAVGMMTLSRSLARGGYRQSAANLAGVGFGMLFGGGVGALVMGTSDCGLLFWPGYLGLSTASLGLVILTFALLTGKR